MAFHPTGNFAYRATWQDGLSSFTVNPATSAFNSIDWQNLGSGEKLATVTVSPNGKSLYLTRKDNGTIQQYSINQSTGLPTAMSPATVSNSGGSLRRLELSQDSAYAYVSYPSSNSVLQYSVNASTGALTPLVPASLSTGTTPYGLAVTW